ncbi:hypothetical protein EDB92DRAFT_1819750 [Lactarius akahatsu]|uniref:Uncharacterized protein n=1 Tax=Lactarius akahatsu TaxID=416441 RepID=A0AAD4LDI6_9AGAM|nr:hypothetical protein EDB92DRAFT_1819750 [Lactarius akahatsu]
MSGGFDLLMLLLLLHLLQVLLWLRTRRDDYEFSRGASAEGGNMVPTCSGNRTKRNVAEGRLLVTYTEHEDRTMQMRLSYNQKTRHQTPEDKRFRVLRLPKTRKIFSEECRGERRGEVPGTTEQPPQCGRVRPSMTRLSRASVGVPLYMLSSVKSRHKVTRLPYIGGTLDRTYVVEILPSTGSVAVSSDVPSLTVNSEPQLSWLSIVTQAALTSHGLLACLTGLQRRLGVLARPSPLSPWLLVLSREARRVVCVDIDYALHMFGPLPIPTTNTFHSDAANHKFPQNITWVNERIPEEGASIIAKASHRIADTVAIDTVVA